jgi:ribosome-associated heat shock protein Hsp15
MESVRVDRWLCAARVFKSRTQATQACVGGLVRVNDDRVKPHYGLRVGDRVRAHTEGGPRILEVRALAEKRLSPALARELFDDHSPPPEPRPKRVRMPQRDPGAGRPTKRERRELDRFRGGED